MRPPVPPLAGFLFVAALLLPAAVPRMAVVPLATVAVTAAVVPSIPAQGEPGREARPRARDLGIRPGVLEPGPLNAITDVAGVRVGQVTIAEGGRARTGVTAILPHPGNLFQDKVAAAIHVFNAFGKLVGSTQVEELGWLETPIVLTNTLGVWDAAGALARWMLEQPGNEGVVSINPVVGETNDSWLNDIRARHVKEVHVRRALETARDGPVDEGSVGAGTGTVAFGWKGGIGTSSRRSPEARGGHTLGVLVQTNFGGNLAIDGVPIWRLIKPPDRRDDGRGSCLIVVATDAPLEARQLKRLAARAIHGMARTGSAGSHGSGDYVIAFSTTRRHETVPASGSAPAGGPASVPPHAPAPPPPLPDNALSPLFQAAIEATEEAIYNSLLRATTVRGRDGHVAEAIPIDRLREILRVDGSGARGG
jgi:D-aminopeptidase